jgi:hypothetical protein
VIALRRLLYVERDRLNRQAVERMVRSVGFELFCVNDSAAAIGAIETVRPHAIATTWRHVDAVEILAFARLFGIPACVYSGWPAERGFRDVWISKTDPDALVDWLRGLGAAEVRDAQADRR